MLRLYKQRVAGSKKERKKEVEMYEKWKKKGKNWEIRVRMLEEKMEEIVSEFKELKQD